MYVVCRKCTKISKVFGFGFELSSLCLLAIFRINRFRLHLHHHRRSIASSVYPRFCKYKGDMHLAMVAIMYVNQT